MDSSLHMHVASLKIQDEIRRASTARLGGIVRILKTGAWTWLLLATVLIVLGLFAIAGTAGSIVLAGGFLALFGACIRTISRNDPTPPEERRVPAGHSGA